MKRTPSLILAILNLLLIATFVIAALLIVPGFTANSGSGSSDGWSWWDLGVVVFVLLGFEGIPVGTLLLVIGDLRRGYRRQGLAAGAISFALMPVPALWLAFGGTLASHAERRVNLAWAETLDPMDTFTARFPEAAISEGALRFEASAARLGIEMKREEAPHSAASDRNAYEAVQKSLFAYVSSQAGKTDEVIDAPPSELSAWLLSHDARITSLEHEVLERGQIAFETRRTDPSQEPLPDFLGLRGPHNVLLLRALEWERRGDSRAALDALEAAWLIGGAVRDRGEDISQHIALALDDETLGVLLRMREVPQSWQSRIGGHDYLTSALRTLQALAWDLSAIGKTVIDAAASKRAGCSVWPPHLGTIRTSFGFQLL